jgi:Domain of unknown function (DUF222)
VAERLPRTLAALSAGRIQPYHVRIIAEETSILSDEDAAKADEILAEAAQRKTFGQLRHAARVLVLKLDPDSARRKKERAKRDAHVRRFREDSGNGGMVAREMPADEVLASWQHIEQRALDLRAAGVEGTLRELRVRAFHDLLQERDSRSGAGQASGNSGEGSGGPHGPSGHGEPDGGGPGGNGGGPGGNGGSGPGPHPGPAGTGPGRYAARDDGPSFAALVTITVPLGTVEGQSDEPAQAAGFGLVDADTARDLVAAAARHPQTRWCATALHPDGTAAAHGCVRGRHRGPPGTTVITPGTTVITPGTTVITPGTVNTRAGPGPPPGTRAQDFLDRLGVSLTPIARRDCDHTAAESHYTPSRKLQHLVRARTTRCSAPGCGRPAARCDLDHTTAWDDGGPTCQCNLAPLCRHHHRLKQTEGWRLEQPEPGVLRWRAPSGRSYATAPTNYHDN